MNYAEIPTDWAEKWAIYSPDKIAFKEYESGRTISFVELNQIGNQVADWIVHDQGLEKGDRLAILAENCLEFIYLFVAAQKTGIVLVPLNYRLSKPEITYLLKDSDPALLLVEQQFKEKIEPSRKKLDLVGSISPLVAKMKAGSEGGNQTTFQSTRRDPDDPIFILYTSGSTGFPKGVRYTHGMLFWNSINTGFSIKVNSDSRTVTCMPPFHTGGWNVLLTPFFHHGGYTCLMKRFDAEAVVQSLEKERATIFMGVPTMLRMMADTHSFSNANFQSLYYFIVGGEAMPIPLIQAWHTKGVPIRQGYGMTECGPNLTSLHQDDAIAYAGSIGRPNFFIQTKIVDDEGNECPIGEPGELLLRGPVVTPGYWNNLEATAKAFQGGWLRTGDRVLQNDGGYLYVVDRIKNMFISGGENVYPAEIERVLLNHPAISEAVVIAVPDPKWGEVGKAFLVAKDHEAVNISNGEMLSPDESRPGESKPGEGIGQAVLSLEDLAAHCQRNLAKFKIPKYFQVLESLPKGDTGKIDRKELQEI